MTHSVLCLRPEADFLRIGVVPPKEFAIRYMGPADPELAAAIADILPVPDASAENAAVEGAVPAGAELGGS